MSFTMFTMLSMLVLFGGLTAALNVEDANAYNLKCAMASNTIKWNTLSALSSQDVTDANTAVANWSDMPVNVSFQKVTSGEVIDFTKVNEGNNFITAHTDPFTCSSGFMSTPEVITLNSYYTDSDSPEQRQNTMAHEFGHAIGLMHSTGTYAPETLMYVDATNWSTYKIFVPTLDDIRGAQALYGSTTSTSECWTFTQSGSVTYTGTCSSTNPALPMTEKVTTAGSGNRAFASDSPSGSSLPSSNTVVTIAKVQPSTLYRFSQGIHTNSNVADGTSRYATVELDNDGIKAAWSDSFGLTETSTLWSGTPSTSTTYFLELVAENANSEAAYAYQDDGGGSTPPTFLGKTTFDTGISSWSGTKYFGTGAWTDSSSNPLSNYNVKEYDNRLK